VTGERPAARPAALPAASPLTVHAFRRTLGHFATGVCVLTARRADSVHGMTLNAFCSVSLEPMLVLASVDRRARILPLIVDSGRFAVSILADHQERLARRFAGQRVGDDPEPVPFRPGLGGGPPVLEGAVAAMRCTVHETFVTGDHLALVGRVTELYGGASTVEPILFYGGRFRHLARPTAADPAAPADLSATGLRVHYGEW
jgi:flavin reductase (DIM6/NTAB) family NADH-FMN oxidoreductase RutF